MDPKMQLAANLRRLRKERGWSQEMLAHFAGLHPTEVSRLERGLREPRLRTVLQVSAALKVSIQELVGPYEEPKKPTAPGSAGAAAAEPAATPDNEEPKPGSEKAA
jgi:transcriptional regulator with XRE-family HTH domain